MLLQFLWNFYVQQCAIGYFNCYEIVIFSGINEEDVILVFAPASINISSISK